MTQTQVVGGAEALKYLHLCDTGTVCSDHPRKLGNIGRHRLRAAGGALGVLLTFVSPAFAQDHDNAAAQANNPLATTTSLNLQNQFIGRLSGFDDPANSVLLRGAQPFSIGDTHWIARATLPINTFPERPGGPRDTGLGDFNIFAAYLIDVGNPGISFGIGPQLTAPTASDRTLGMGKWSAGFANVLFDATSRVWQYGYLLTWQASVSGDDDRKDVNAGAFQPFLFRQLGEGWYLRSSGIWVYDFESDAWAVPIGLGVGRVIPLGKRVMNIFVEPQYSVLRHGDGQMEWGIFAGVNFQFRL